MHIEQDQLLTQANDIGIHFITHHRHHYSGRFKKTAEHSCRLLLLTKLICVELAGQNPTEKLVKKCSSAADLCGFTIIFHHISFIININILTPTTLERL